MEYFLMLPDKRIPNILSFSVEEKVISSNKPFVINIGNQNDMVFADLIIKRFLFNTYFIISHELMRVFQMYDDEIAFTSLLITNEDYKMSKVYWLVDIKESKDVITNKFLDAKDMTVNKDQIMDKPIHRIHYEKQAFLLINQCVTESILRRFPSGINFQEVKQMR